MTEHGASEGIETWRRLRDWQGDSAAAERLAAHILNEAGYTGIDPSHPRGGPDGAKDVVCLRDGRPWIGAVFFANGKVSLGKVRTKFKGDLEGAARNGAVGIAFLTNQELTLGQRDEMQVLAGEKAVEIFHLERIAQMLDRPALFGTRLQFLGIAMSPAEQLSFFAQRDKVLDRIVQSLGAIERAVSTTGKPLEANELVDQIRSVVSEISARRSQFRAPAGTSTNRKSAQSDGLLEHLFPLEWSDTLDNDVTRKAIARAALVSRIGEDPVLLMAGASVLSITDPVPGKLTVELGTGSDRMYVTCPVAKRWWRLTGRHLEVTVASTVIPSIARALAAEERERGSSGMNIG